MAINQIRATSTVRSKHCVHQCLAGAGKINSQSLVNEAMLSLTLAIRANTINQQTDAGDEYTLHQTESSRPQSQFKV